MKRVFFYKLDTGEILPGSLTGSQELIDANTPDGCGTVVEVSDWRRQRVNLTTGALEACAPVELPTDTLAQEARQQRDVLLAASDWTQLVDAPLTEEQRAAWAAYRADLRAVPDQAGFPQAIVWPSKPGDDV